MGGFNYNRRTNRDIVGNRINDMDYYTTPKKKKTKKVTRNDIRIEVLAKMAKSGKFCNEKYLTGYTKTKKEDILDVLNELSTNGFLIKSVKYGEAWAITDKVDVTYRNYYKL